MTVEKQGKDFPKRGTVIFDSKSPIFMGWESQRYRACSPPGAGKFTVKKRYRLDVRHDAFQQQELSRRMGTSPQDVNRLIDLHHATKIDKVEQVFEALGLRLDLTVCA